MEGVLLCNTEGIISSAERLLFAACWLAHDMNGLVRSTQSRYGITYTRLKVPVDRARHAVGSGGPRLHLVPPAARHEQRVARAKLDAREADALLALAMLHSKSMRINTLVPPFSISYFAGAACNARFNTSLSTDGEGLEHGSDAANVAFGVVWSVFWPVVGGKFATPAIVRREKARIRREAEEAAAGRPKAPNAI